MKSILFVSIFLLNYCLLLNVLGSSPAAIDFGSFRVRLINGVIRINYNEIPLVKNERYYLLIDGKKCSGGQFPNSIVQKEKDHLLILSESIYGKIRRKLIFKDETCSIEFNYTFNSLIKNALEFRYSLFLEPEFFYQIKDEGVLLTCHYSGDKNEKHHLDPMHTVLQNKKNVKRYYQWEQAAVTWQTPKEIRMLTIKPKKNSPNDIVMGFADERCPGYADTYRVEVGVVTDGKPSQEISDISFCLSFIFTTR